MQHADTRSEGAATTTSATAAAAAAVAVVVVAQNDPDDRACYIAEYFAERRVPFVVFQLWEPAALDHFPAHVGATFPIVRSAPDAPSGGPRFELAGPGHARDGAAALLLGRVRGVVILGGPMSVHDGLPHFGKIFSLLGSAIAHSQQNDEGGGGGEIPVLGVCLGAQLLATFLRGVVTVAPTPEFGWTTLRVVPGEAAALWFGAGSDAEDSGSEALAENERNGANGNGHHSDSGNGCSDGDGGKKATANVAAAALRVFEWHVETFSIPPSCDLLVTGEACANQAFALRGRNVVGLQFHPEVDMRKARAWLATGHSQLRPELAAGIGKTLTDEQLRRTHRLAARVLDRWCQALLPL